MSEQEEYIRPKTNHLRNLAIIGGVVLVVVLTMYWTGISGCNKIEGTIVWDGLKITCHKVY